jgi:hypothetical protein
VIAPSTSPLPSPPSRRVSWRSTYRLIPSRYPPIDAFERLAPSHDWHALMELEALTNPRLRQEAGAIHLVPADQVVTGPGASIVMAPFTHVSRDRPSRFSNGTYGVYYAARSFETALLEVAFHMGRFHAATADPPTTGTYRAYKGSLDKALHDIRGDGFAALLQPDVGSYALPQTFAAQLRSNGSHGLVYPSVRHTRGQCLAAFRPTVISIPVQDRHVDLRWDGTTISGWFDYADPRLDPSWRTLPT